MRQARRRGWAPVWVTAALLFLLGGLPPAYAAQKPVEPLKQTRLLQSLPEYCNTPDGMALDPENNIILACPNFNNEAYPGVLMRIDKANRVSLLYPVPVHPETRRANPMGMEFDAAGNLYLADNQYFTDRNNKSRLLKIEFRNGQPQRTVLVASGLKLSNAVRIHDGYVYLTDTEVRDDVYPLVSGVYRFQLGEEGVQIKPGTDDPHLIATLKTFNKTLSFGADGMAFDRQGNLYVGNFGDGTVHKLTFDAQGNVGGNTIFARSERMKSCDGLWADSRNNIYVADSVANAIQMILPDGTVKTLAQNGDTDGSDGGLDQPCEVIIRGRQMVVSNFDKPFEGCVNTKFDAPYTLSVIDLDQ